MAESAGPKGSSIADSEVVDQLDYPRGETANTTTSIAPRGDRRRAQPEVFRAPRYPDVPPAPRRRAGLTVRGYLRRPGPLSGPLELKWLLRARRPLRTRCAAVTTSSAA